MLGEQPQGTGRVVQPLFTLPRSPVVHGPQPPPRVRPRNAFVDVASIGGADGTP